MQLERKTKNELIAQIRNLDLRIERYVKDLDAQMIHLRNQNDKLISNKKEIDNLNNQLKIERIRSLSNFQSIVNMLLIYESEHMTHREKAYLGGKIKQVATMMINEMQKSIALDSGNYEDLPF